MKSSPFTEGFDIDITLRDAALDPDNSPNRRALANLAIGMEVNDAYYSVRELRETIQWVHEGVSGGKKRLATILGNDCDDYQRAIYYALAGRGLVNMLDDLVWLEHLLHARGRIAGEAVRNKIVVANLTDPYIVKEAAAPVGKFDPNFTEGPAWWLDESLTHPERREVSRR